MGLISRKLSRFLLMFLLALLHSVSYLFFLYQSLSLCLCMVFDSISSNMNEVLSVNLSGNVFVFFKLTMRCPVSLHSLQLFSC